MWDRIKQAFADKLIDWLAVGVVVVLITLAKWFLQLPIGYLIPLALGLFIVVLTIALLIKRYLGRKSKKGIVVAPTQGYAFYPCRPEMTVLRNFIKKHDVLYAVFATGEVLESYHLYDAKRFKYMILLDPQGKQIEARPTDPKHFATTRARIISVSKYAQSLGIDVRWWEGCLPFSLILGNPDSESNGEALLEIHVPYSEGYERPTIVFEQRAYADLFNLLKQSYEKLLANSRKAEIV